MKTILIVDNHNEMRENIAELLELEGYRVMTASNGLEGILMAQFLLPDLILCDIKMEGLSGYEVLTFLKQQKKTKDIPFVFVTALSEKQAKLTGLNMGACDYLIKPFTEDELVNTVKKNLLNELEEIKNMLISFINPRLYVPYNQQLLRYNNLN
jgi:CheY-like chemotaxis protein